MFAISQAESQGKNCICDVNNSLKTKKIKFQLLDIEGLSVEPHTGLVQETKN